MPPPGHAGRIKEDFVKREKDGRDKARNKKIRTVGFQGNLIDI